MHMYHAYSWNDTGIKAGVNSDFWIPIPIPVSIELKSSIPIPVPIEKFNSNSFKLNSNSIPIPTTDFKISYGLSYYRAT